MDQNKRLADNIRALAGGVKITIYQGIVEKTDGVTCSCRIGNMTVSGVRLRASLSEMTDQMLVVPAVGSAVIVGSMTGDLSNLVVLQVDRIKRIEINGGKLGGLVNIRTLTEKINALVDAYNTHTHTVTTTGSATAQAGTAAAVAIQAQRLVAADYEDDKIVH